ncbi:PREDICTED: monocyte to macrophage differentiation factor 2 isoform X2 [Nicrophorus vespilloides]|nr:PREDICTED: monocyte to macrophage differentiation factor 2 isoform X2 [Nicrophorus vespilloides]XP_017771292.1 PREDICTED: monocyte to macrophage differentiation factor 2 isoform X2 [Nicrophorus vespilloides]
MLNNTSIFQQCLEITKKIVPQCSLKEVQWKNQKPKAREAYCPTEIEHIANVITHGVAIVPSILGTYELCYRSENFAQLISALLYGATLVFLFGVSTCFHCIFYRFQRGRWKDTLHRCDRAMIYIFIAGSYFPWLTVKALPTDGWASSMKWIVWLLASLGIIYQQVFHEKYKSLETIFYVIIGIFPSLPIIAESDFSGLTELKLGGIFYVVGIIFFKADGFIPCAHAIWHIFVIIAAGVHYFAILNHLYPDLPPST